MRVVHNDQIAFVSWKYDDPVNPNFTECKLQTEDKEVIKSVAVKRYYTDPCSKEKARMFSLTKLANTLYPNPIASIQKVTRDGKVTRSYTEEEKALWTKAKENRKKIWDAYRSRNEKK